MEVRHLSFLSSRSFVLKDQPGHVILKSLSVLLDLGWFLLRFPLALWWADRVFIHRNIAPLGPPILEWIAAISTDRLIYDFDDAIYLNPDTARNRWLGPLKMNSMRTRSILRMADVVIAGNEYLASYARQYQADVQVIPTGLDLPRYRAAKASFGTNHPTPNPNHNPDQLVIGWVGGPGTSIFVKELMPLFERVLAEFPKSELHLLGADFESDHDRVHTIEWDLSNELTHMAAFSIGINPLQDNDFTRGKCGFKVIQYQALGIPVISSPVGVCTEQVVPGIDGYLPTDEATWEVALRTLLGNAELRAEMSRASGSRADAYDCRLLAEAVANLLVDP